jgi:hypothetical protein
MTREMKKVKREADLRFEGPDVVDVVGGLVRELIDKEIVPRVHRHEPLEVRREAAPEHPRLMVPRLKCLANPCRKRETA